MRPIKLSSALVAAAALLATAPTGAVAAHGPKLPKHKGHASPVGCRVSLSADPHVVTSGEAVLLSGALACPGGSGVNSQAVTVYERIAGVPGGFKIIGTATTGPTGTYTFTPPVVVTDSTFFTRVAGARSANRTARVAPQVTLATSPALPEGTQLLTGPGHKVKFTGAVNPADAGAEVLLQREAGGSSEEWGTIQEHVFVQLDGTYTFLHRFVVPGDANLRTVVRPHGKFDTRGVSNTLTYEISQTQNPNLTLEPSADPVTYGSTLKLKGVLKAGAGQKVTLMARTFGTSLSKVAETTTGTGGAYEFVIPSAVQNTYYKATSGTVNSALLFEGVKWVISGASATATKATSGTPVTFSGNVSPKERVGHTVYLERQDSGSTAFHVVDLGFVQTGGTFSITYDVIGSGKQVYRIKVPGDPINQAASTTPFEIEVTPALSIVKPLTQPSLPH